MTTDSMNPGFSRERAAFPSSAPSDPQAPHVRTASITVDAAADGGELARIWETIGYDEINWTSMPTGKHLLQTFAELPGGRPFWVRPHYVFCSGTGFAIPHWGNGNVYHQDAEGRPSYDFTIVDQVYDAIVGAGHHLLVELAFTPRDLLPDEADELTVMASPTVYSAYEAGSWAYPPKDYAAWGDLVAAHAQHCRDRYGADEVDRWLWELWNEPDIFYWKGSPQQFYDLYTVTAEAIRRVLPGAKVGGPAVTGGGTDFLRGFLSHTRATGTPVDFVSFHTKGSAFTPWRAYGPTGAPAAEQQSPSLPKMIFEIRSCLRVIAEFEEYHHLPAVVDECDAGVPAHYGLYDNANFVFQNTEYYPVFQVKMIKKLLDLNAAETVQVTHATSWSFYFEGERYFEGTRAFLTAGRVEKPFLNAYRMLGRLGRTRLPATSTAGWTVDQLDDTIGQSMPEEVDALASRDDDGTVSIMVWRHTDDQYHTDDTEAAVSITIDGLTAPTYEVRHLRIDRDHSNAHTVWQSLGGPQDPTEEQLTAIRARQGLESFAPLLPAEVVDGTLTLPVSLPLPSVSLIILTPIGEDRA